MYEFEKQKERNLFEKWRKRYENKKGEGGDDDDDDDDDGDDGSSSGNESEIYGISITVWFEDVRHVLEVPEGSTTRFVMFVIRNLTRPLRVADFRLRNLQHIKGLDESVEADEEYFMNRNPGIQGGSFQSKLNIVLFIF